MTGGTLNETARNVLSHQKQKAAPLVKGEAEIRRRGVFFHNKGKIHRKGSACDASEDTPSHVLSAMGVEPVYARGTIRISLGEENTVEDVERIISALKEIFACYAVF